VNALAACRPDGPRPRLDWRAAARAWEGRDVRDFLRSLPASGPPRVVVPGNAGLHTGGAVKAARRQLAREGIFLYFLPPYSPELNEIEPLLRLVKYHDMPERSYASRGGLRVGVEEGFTTRREKLRPKRETQPRPAA
jgi:putative transposase